MELVVKIGVIMKNKVILFFLCFCLLAVPVYADDESTDVGEPVQDYESDVPTPSTVVVDITSLINQGSSKDDDEEEDIKSVVSLEPELVGFTQTKQTVTAADSSGLKSVLLSILGDYETVVTDYEYRNNNNTYYSHSISIERDWAWLCSCGIFAILLYCTFRTIGGIAARF